MLLTHSSFGTEQLSPKTRPERLSTAAAYLLPSFKYLPEISLDSESVERLAQQVVNLQPPANAALTEVLEHEDGEQAVFGTTMSEILVLICSHGTRDSRCGILGPILQAEFEDKLQRLGVALKGGSMPSESTKDVSARVGMISHIGGHRWAGNVIVAFPPHLAHDLAGKVIWYGRVAPAHVEGIVRETVLDGKIIVELYRGGIDQNRSMLRL